MKPLLLEACQLIPGSPFLGAGATGSLFSEGQGLPWLRLPPAFARAAWHLPSLRQGPEVMWTEEPHSWERAKGPEAPAASDGARGASDLSGRGAAGA